MQAEIIEERIRVFILDQFPLARRKNISSQDRLLENGILDSLGVLDLVSFLEAEFAIVVSDDELVPDVFQSLECLATFVQQKSNGAELE